jgi:predicted metalloprotease
VAGAFGDEPSSAPDERDHGSGESNRRWILAGFDTNDVARCNTFSASSGDVN